MHTSMHITYFPDSSRAKLVIQRSKKSRQEEKAPNDVSITEELPSTMLTRVIKRLYNHWVESTLLGYGMESPSCTYQCTKCSCGNSSHPWSICVNSLQKISNLG
ncbi:hypothetical protein AVEN_253546-1 [Araneus ventricosus]|uniref:Uncharacterized protein n=1 Tax=Araneus ventricosus TaxID=182803 RepID=A0A4Y2BSP4_ARAVE|nr:hypothetical protein AVEN_253546-1 [Araneus ventricosus]